MADFIPERDLDFVEWIDNFLVYTAVSPATVGLTTADITTITQVRDDLRGALTDTGAARTAYESAVVTKRLAREKAEKVLRQHVRKVQIAEQLTDATRAALQINGKASVAPPSQPVVPRKLTVTGSSEGTNRLDWERNGNAQGTVFVIEARLGDALTWTQLDVVTATKYLHKDQKPGVAIVYRVRARRRNRVSEPSNEASLYR